MLTIFSYVYGLSVLFEEVSIQVLCPFFNQIVCVPGVESYEFFTCFRDVLVWWNPFLSFLEKPLSDVLLANMFSHTVGSLFILIMVSLAVQKILIWYSHICLFFPLFPMQGMCWQKYCYARYLKFYCLCFPLEFLWYHDLYLNLLSVLSLLWCVV